MNNNRFVKSIDPIYRARLRFGIIFSLAVLGLCFFLGIALGLRKDVRSAFAANVPTHSSNALKLAFPLPQGLAVTPIGDEATVNGRATQTVSFRSSRAVREILEEQVRLWESAGYKAFGRGTNSRGVAVAIDVLTGSRYTITAWSVPESLRENGVDDLTAGIAGFLDGGGTSANDRVRRGEIKGIPPMSGGEAGTLFSSVDEDGKSQTTVYTNPGEIEKNIEFYRRLLDSSGWVFRNGPVLDNEKGTAAMQFSRYSEELTLLFSEKRSSAKPKTIVSATLRQPR